MLFCVYDAGQPVEYSSCGNLVSQGGFVHSRRNIDSFVLIVVCRGVLHIAQNGHKYHVKENEALVLFPHKTHYGFLPSEGELSYFWTHFYITDPNYYIYSKNTLLRENQYLKNPDPLSPAAGFDDNRHFILPEFCRLGREQRAVLLFSQLLDMAKRDNFQYTWRTRYALNLLLAEYHAEFLENNTLVHNTIPNNVKEILEWIRAHYTEKITVAELAGRFHYNPTYLTSLIRRFTGHTVSEVINRFRINSAKNILCSYSKRITISEVAALCGFSDAKYFMRVFGRQEGMTPSQYRDAFHEKKLVIR